MTDIAVIDYGMGNLRSVSKAIEHVAPQLEVTVTSDPEVVMRASRVVFPGQGAMPVFAKFCREYGRQLALWFEPGKFLTAQAGTLLVRINTVKQNRNRCICGTDSGFPQLIRPMFYDAYHAIDNISNPEGRPGVYDICGNICETGDLFAKDRTMPEIREGDLLAIRTAGAYCYAMGGTYNLRPMPAEVVVENNGYRLSRKRLSPSELVALITGETLGNKSEIRTNAA